MSQPQISRIITSTIGDDQHNGYVLRFLTNHDKEASYLLDCIHYAEYDKRNLKTIDLNAFQEEMDSDWNCRDMHFALYFTYDDAIHYDGLKLFGNRQNAQLSEKEFESILDSAAMEAQFKEYCDGHRLLDICEMNEADKNVTAYFSQIYNRDGFTARQYDICHIAQIKKNINLTSALSEYEKYKEELRWKFKMLYSKNATLIS